MYIRRITALLWVLFKTGGRYEPTKDHFECWSDLLFCFSLMIKNTSFIPQHPLISVGDAGKIEWSYNIFSWDPNACALSLLSCKSGVWGQSDIRKSPLLKEAICMRKLMEQVEYYLAQSECSDNMVLTDASCLQFISRFKDYSSDIMELHLSLMRHQHHLTPVVVAGRVMGLSDILSRSLTKVKIDYGRLSKEQARLLPPVTDMPTFYKVSAAELMEILNKEYDVELLDCSLHKSYGMILDWTRT